MVRGQPRAKRPCHKILNLLPSLYCQVICDRIVVKRKLGPDDEMYDPFIDSVGPIVVENLDIISTAQSGLPSLI